MVHNSYNSTNRNKNIDKLIRSNCTLNIDELQNIFNGTDWYRYSYYKRELVIFFVNLMQFCDNVNIQLINDLLLQYCDTFIFELIVQTCKVNINEQTIGILYARFYDLKYIDQILKIYNISPNKKILDYLMIYIDHQTKIKFLEELLNFRILPDEQTSHNLIKNIYIDSKTFAYVIDILVCYGYTLTYNNIIDALKYGKYIPNIQKYGFKVDEDLYFHCHRYELCNVYSFNINSDIIKMRNMFNNKKLTIIQKYMNKNNDLKFDRYCFDNACNNKNLDVIKYLMDKQIKPTLKSIFNLAKNNYCITLTRKFQNRARNISASDYHILCDIKNYIMVQLDHDMVHTLNNDYMLT